MNGTQFCFSYSIIKSNYNIVIVFCYVAYVWASSPYLNTLIKNVLFIAFLIFFIWLIFPVSSSCLDSTKSTQSMAYILIFGLLNYLFWNYEKRQSQKIEEQKQKRKRWQKKWASHNERLNPVKFINRMKI